MRKLDQKLHDEILVLKKLHTKVDKTEFYEMRDDIMKRYKVGISLIYTQMKRVVPGMCSTSPHSTKTRPIREEEILMVRELLWKQLSIGEVRRAMEFHTGDTYGLPRLRKIRDKIDKRKWPEDEVKTGVMVFGDNLRKLFYEYSRLELIEPDRRIRLKLNKKEYSVNCGVVKDALDMIIFSAENEGRSTPAINRMKMESMLSRKMDLITKGHYISTFELRALESIRRSMETAKNMRFHPDYQVLVGVCRDIHPDISDIQIFMLADKHQRLIHESTDEIVPFREKVQKLAVKEMQESM